MQTDEGRSQAVRFSRFEVDLQTGEIRKGSRKVKLQEQPFQVLAVLLARPGELVTREELQQKLWPAETIDFDTGLNKAVKKLREALDDSADNPRFVQTLPRRGYRFIAPVERAAVSSAPTPTEDARHRDGH
jgi:DNA-binding winged helix-turn-helix (wHTH) protein